MQVTSVLVEGDIFDSITPGDETTLEITLVDAVSGTVEAGSFDWVLNFFTSFGYFERERENFRVLEEIVRILAPGGRFLIDLMNLDSTLAHLREYERREEGENPGFHTLMLCFL